MISVDELMERALPDGWMWKTMGDIADVVSGGTPSTSDASNFESGEIPWLTPADLSGYAAKFVDGGARNLTPKGLQSCSAKLIPAGTVLFTSRAPIGYVAIASNPISTNQGFKNFVLREGVLPEYVYWWLKGAKQLAESLASGTTFLEISGTNAKKLPIPIAPLAKQREIVAELEKQFSRLDEAVANLQRVKTNLKRYKASVLKAAVEGRLVETEATLARREGRTYETGEQLLQRILEERRAKWNRKGEYKEPVAAVASDLFGLPEGWALVTYCQLGEVTTGFTPPTGDAANFGGATPFFKPTDLDAGDSVRVAREYLSAAGLQKGRKLPAGSVLVTCIGATIGKTGLTQVDCATNQQINSVSPIDGRVDSRYLFWWTCSPDGQAQIVDNASATTLPILNKSKFEALPVALPPFAEQVRIVAEVDRHLSIIREVEAEVDANLQRAQALRQATLSKAFAVR